MCEYAVLDLRINNISGLLLELLELILSIVTYVHVMSIFHKINMVNMHLFIENVL